MESYEVLSRFEIPKDLAMRLTEATIKETVRKSALKEATEENYDFLEKKLVEINFEQNNLAKEVFKYIPEEFKSANYKWIYNGIDIDDNYVSITYA